MMDCVDVVEVVDCGEHRGWGDRRQAILDVIFGKAMEGDVRAAAFLFDRVDGRVPLAVAPEVGTGVTRRRADLSRLGIEELEAIGKLLRGEGGAGGDGTDAGGGGAGDTEAEVSG